MNIKNAIKLFVLISLLFSQSAAILPGQKSAISSLASSAGLSTEDLNSLLLELYGVDLDRLTQNQGADVIRTFQSGDISKPKVKVEKKAASFIEVGMKKQFHFRDGSVRDGEIVSVKDGSATLKTGSGTFTIPMSEFLDETAKIKNKKGELFNGVVLGETEEEFILRTQYGDAVIQKRDISSMKRYYGGILDRQTENKKQFYQGKDELMNIFLDPTAFPLTANTFYVSGLSIGYGLTDRFMMTSLFGSNFSGDLNLNAKMRFYHKKSASSELAASWGAGIHRAYPSSAIVAKYSHAVNVTRNDTIVPLNEMDGNENPLLEIDQVANNSNRHLFAQAYIVFSSRRTNPSGRGKVGWSAGAKISNALMSKGELLKDPDESSPYTFAWSQEGKYKVPYRIWAGLEYDLRKDLKFLALAWLDNGYKTMDFAPTWKDYLGSDGTTAFSIDSPLGSPSLIDFDFGIQYAVSETFRFGIHFQQPYLDFYWEFFEF